MANNTNPYENNIKRSKKMRAQSLLTENLYTKFLNCKDLTDICNNLLSIITDVFAPISLPFKLDYISYYCNQLVYEIIMEIYNCSLISIPASKEGTSGSSMRKCIDTYTLFQNNADNFDTLEQVISKTKKNYKQESLLKRRVEQSYRKANTFREYTFNIIEEKPMVSILPEEDLIFNLLYYPRSIYCQKNHDRGIYFSNFHQMVNDYLIMHKSEDSSILEEYSAFLFEKMHYPIQYQNSMISFLKLINSEDLPENAGLLVFYNKFFDTNFLSLTDFILNKYKDLLPVIFKDKENVFLRLQMFSEFQFYESYLLPMLTLIIEDVLFIQFSSNIKEISVHTGDYISHTLNKKRFHDNYSYKECLRVSTNNVDDYIKNLKKSDIKKAKILNGERKTDRKEAAFDLLYSKCFFEQEIPNYITLWTSEQMLQKNNKFGDSYQELEPMSIDLLFKCLFENYCILSDYHCPNTN